MKINGIPYRSIMLDPDALTPRIIDQRKLPWKLEFADLTSTDAVCRAIKEMWTRGAPLIGAVGAYGLCLALRDDPSDNTLRDAYDKIIATRPTAINLTWALDEMVKAVKPLPAHERVAAAYKRAADICEEDVALNRAIGEHGLGIIKQIAAKKSGKPVNILTHCNAGWLATIDYGTATAPMYLAHDAGIPLHIWVDETRPRNQGAALTAFELAQHGVPHTVICDNAGGLLMQRGEVDMVIVGADRVTRNGDVCNKIGTYLKALAAQDNKVPFYVALPYTTIDRGLEMGSDIPIEERGEDEVTLVHGITGDNRASAVRITQSRAANPAFDITPARFVSGYVTEKGLLTRI